MLPPDTATAQISPSMEVREGLSLLLRKCPRCHGYASRPRLVVEEWTGPADKCPVCSPVRDWFWTVFAVDFEVLT